MTDPRPNLHMGRAGLPGRDDLARLNGFFRRALDASGSAHDRVAGEALLNAYRKSANQAIAVYATWLGLLLGWCRRHPDASPGPLPGDNAQGALVGHDSLEFFQARVDASLRSAAELDHARREAASRDEGSWLRSTSMWDGVPPGV